MTRSTVPSKFLPAIFCVAKILLQCHVPPRHWPELRSLLPRPPLQLHRPVQLSIQLDETLGGPFVRLQGAVELVSFQYLIYLYIII